jgi:hypothetical protein
LQIADPGEQARARDRTIQTFTAIGQHARALELWHLALAFAREAGRDRFAATLGAGAGAIATIDRGQTLRTVLEAVNEVEGWWGAFLMRRPR